MDRGCSIKDGTQFFGFDDDENPRLSISQCAMNHIFPVGISEISKIHAGISGYSLHVLHICIHFANSLWQKIFKNLEAKSLSMNKVRPSLFRFNIKLAPGKKYSGNRIYNC